MRRLLPVSIDNEIADTILFIRGVSIIPALESAVREHQVTAAVTAVSSPGRAKGVHLAVVLAAHVLEIPLHFTEGSAWKYKRGKTPSSSDTNGSSIGNEGSCAPRLQRTPLSLCIILQV
jgi:hypothetical protein